jgi:hypothetical protein
LEASVVHGIQKLAFEEFITVDPKTSGPRVWSLKLLEKEMSKH